jgi:hypothetical protein
MHGQRQFTIGFRGSLDVVASSAEAALDSAAEQLGDFNVELEVTDEVEFDPRGGDGPDD